MINLKFSVGHESDDSKLLLWKGRLPGWGFGGKFAEKRVSCSKRRTYLTANCSTSMLLRYWTLCKLKINTPPAFSDKKCSTKKGKMK